MMKYNESLQKAGVLLALDGLHPPSMGARVTFAGGKPKVTDGPFAEAKEVLGGYWMIQVKSKEEAIEWAKRCPGVGQRDHRGPPGPGDRGLPRRRQEAAAGLRRDAGESRAASAKVRDALGLALPGADDGVIGGRDGHRQPIAPSTRSGGSSRPRLIAGLARMVRDVGLAEELAQDALVAALEHWPESGVPRQPGRLADGHRQAPRHRPPAPQQAPRAQARGARPRAGAERERTRAGSRRRRSTTTSATTCCA